MPDDDSREQPRVFRLRISEALMIAIVMQTAAAVWWAAGSSQRLDHLEKITAPLESGLLARIDERTGSMRNRMDRMSDLLQTLVLSKSPPTTTVIQRSSAPATPDALAGDGR